MAADPAIAALIREVLAEELARLRPEVREERVRVVDDADLAAFAGRVLAMAGDGAAREAFENGTLVFRLDNAPGRAGAAAAGADTGRVHGGRGSSALGAPSSRNAAAGIGAGATVDATAGGTARDTVVVESGLVSERHVDRLPPGTTRLRFGRRARMTPLARDRLRRRGIVVEQAD